MMNCAHVQLDRIRCSNLSPYAFCMISCTIMVTFKKRLAWSLNCLLNWKELLKEEDWTSWNFLIDEDICFLLNRWSLHAKHGRILQIWGRRVRQWPQQHLPSLVAAAVAAAAATTLGQAVVLTALSLVHQCLPFLWPRSHRQLHCQVPDVKVVVTCCTVHWLMLLKILDSLWKYV